MSAITAAIKMMQKKQAAQVANTRPTPQGMMQVPERAAPSPGGNTVDAIMQRYTGNPYSALTDSNMNRQGSPQDLAYWYTYGAGPEFSYFNNNNTGTTGPTVPSTPGVPGRTNIPPGKVNAPNLGVMGGPLAGLQIPALQQLMQQYGSAGGTNRTQAPRPVMRDGGPITQMGLGGLFKKLKHSLKFEGFNLKHMLHDIGHDPQRLLTGAVDPLGTKITNKVLGTHYDPVVNQLGGPTKQRFLDAEAHGIDTGLAQNLHKVAGTVAGFYGGQALSGLAGNGLENLAYDMPSMSNGLTTAGKLADSGKLGTPLTKAGDMLDTPQPYVYDPGTGEMIPNPEFQRSQVQYNPPMMSRGGPLSVLRNWR